VSGSLINSDLSVSIGNIAFVGRLATKQLNLFIETSLMML